jgi:hypothetical protein
VTFTGTVTDENGRSVTVSPGQDGWDGSTVAGRLIKSEPTRRYTLAVAYPADKPDVAKARDGYRDFVGKEVLQDAAWAYLKDHRVVGAWHAKDGEGAGEVVESYVWPDGAPDWQPEGSEYVVKSGDWLMGVVWEPDAWAEIEAGRMRGLSPQGKAQRRPASRARTGSLRS